MEVSGLESLSWRSVAMVKIGFGDDKLLSREGVQKIQRLPQSVQRYFEVGSVVRRR
jgi:hypothetical protein